MKIVWHVLSVIFFAVSLAIIWFTNSEQGVFFYAAGVMFSIFGFSRELQESRTVRIEKVVTDVRLDQEAFTKLFINAVSKVTEVAEGLKKKQKSKS